MTQKKETKVELEESQDFESLIKELGDLRDSMKLTDQEKELISSKEQEDFKDVQFELLPSYDEAGNVLEPSGSPLVTREEQDSLSLPFTFSEDTEISFDPLHEIARPVVFLFAPEETLWLVDHNEENIFRFLHFSGKELLHSFSVPQGAEKYCIGYPGNILADDQGDIYILDVVQHTIHKFSDEGEYDNDFQDQLLSARPLQGVRDFDIIFDEGLLLVSEYVKPAIRKFSLDGTEKGEILLCEGPLPQAFETVTGLATSRDGHCFVIDPAKCEILELSMEGKRVGGFFLEKRAREEIPFCAILKMNLEDILFLVDFDTQLIHTYNREGMLKGVFSAGIEAAGSQLRLGYFDISKRNLLFFINPLSSTIQCLRYNL